MKKWDNYSASYTTQEALYGQTRSSVKHMSKISKLTGSNQPRQRFSRQPDVDEPAIKTNLSKELPPLPRSPNFNLIQTYQPNTKHKLEVARSVGDLHERESGTLFNLPESHTGFDSLTAYAKHTKALTTSKS